MPADTQRCSFYEYKEVNNNYHTNAKVNSTKLLTLGTRAEGLLQFGSLSVIQSGLYFAHYNIHSFHNLPSGK